MLMQDLFLNILNEVVEKMRSEDTLNQENIKFIEKTKNPMLITDRDNVRRLKLYIFCILFAINAALPNTCLAATYYLDAINGNDTLGNGSTASPWKTLSKAQSQATDGDTVKLRNGEYGAFIETGRSTNRTDWITYMADDGHTPVLSYIKLSNEIYGTAKDYYLKFDGLNAIMPEPDPLPPQGTGYWQTDSERLVRIFKANYAIVQNCTLVGWNKYCSHGAKAYRCSNVSFLNNEQHTTLGGMHGEGMHNWTVSGNYIHNMGEGSGLRIINNPITGEPPTNVVWENNHLYDMGGSATADDPYFPWQPAADYHMGSLFAIKSPNVTMRGNIAHYGGSQGIYFYNGYDPYSNMVIENNLFYDTGCLVDFDPDPEQTDYRAFTGRTTLQRINGSCIVRNNTFIGRVTDSGLGKYDILNRYYAGTLTVSFEPGFDGNGFVFYNNIIVGQWSLPDPTDESLNNYLENNNIFWEQGGNSGTRNKLGDNTFFAVWRLGAPTYMLQGYPNYFEKIGESAVNTTQYNYVNDGVTAFFVNPGFYTGSVGDCADAGRTDLDYSLADGSPGVNFGDPYNQPSDSLGTVGPDGFIGNDGVARDENHHSAGCYEYSPTDPNDYWPSIPIGGKTVNENELLEFIVNVQDSNDPNRVLSTEPLPNGATFEDKTFSWTPTYEQAGCYDVNFILTDDEFEDIETVTITVNNINRKPEIESIGNKTVNENATVTFAVNADDPDGDSVLCVGDNLPAGSTFDNQTFEWTPGYNQAGSYIMSFIATDGELEDVESVVITVNNINRAPVLAPIGNKSVTENENLSFTIGASDADGDTITYSAQNLPDGAVFSGNTFTWTPTQGQSGSYQVTFIASDGQNTDSETITITVSDDDEHAPVLEPIGNKSVKENETLSFTINASDADDDTITYSAQNLPTGAVFNAKTFTWTPIQGQIGSYQVIFIAGDGQNTDSETITITVNVANRQPVMDETEDKSVKENRTLSFKVSATDPDGDTLIYLAQNLPDGATFNNRTFRWQPWFDQQGIYEVTFIVSDGQLEDSQTITISADDIVLSGWYKRWLKYLGML